MGGGGAGLSIVKKSNGAELLKKSKLAKDLENLIAQQQSDEDLLECFKRGRKIGNFKGRLMKKQTVQILKPKKELPKKPHYLLGVHDKKLSREIVGEALA